MDRLEKTNYSKERSTASLGDFLNERSPIFKKIQLIAWVEGEDEPRRVTISQPRKSEQRDDHDPSILERYWRAAMQGLSDEMGRVKEETGRV